MAAQDVEKSLCHLAPAAIVYANEENSTFPQDYCVLAAALSKLNRYAKGARSGSMRMLFGPSVNIHPVMVPRFRQDTSGEGK